MLALGILLSLFATKIVTEGKGGYELFASAGSVINNNNNNTDIALHNINFGLESHVQDAAALPPDPPDEGGPPPWPTTATVAPTYTPYYGVFASNSITVFIGSESAAETYVRSTGRPVFVASSPVLLRVLAATDGADFFLLNDGRVLTDFACAGSFGFTATVENARIQFPNSQRAREVIKRFHQVGRYDGQHTLPSPYGRGSAYASSLYGAWSISFTIGEAYIQRLERHNEQRERYFTVILPARKLALEREQQAVRARRVEDRSLLIEQEQECILNARAAMENLWVNRIRSFVAYIFDIFVSLIATTESGRNVVVSAKQNPRAFLGSFVVSSYEKLINVLSSAGRLDAITACSAVHQVTSEIQSPISDEAVGAKSLKEEHAVPELLDTKLTEGTSQLLEESGPRSVAKRTEDRFPVISDNVQESGRRTTVAHGSGVEDKPAGSAVSGVVTFLFAGWAFGVGFSMGLWNGFLVVSGYIGAGFFALIKQEAVRLAGLIHELVALLVRVILDLYQVAATTISATATWTVEGTVDVFEGVLMHIGKHKTIWSYVLAPFIVLPVMLSRRRRDLAPETPLQHTRRWAQVGKSAEGLVVSSVGASAAIVFQPAGGEIFTSNVATQVIETTPGPVVSSAPAPVLKTSYVEPVLGEAAEARTLSIGQVEVALEALCEGHAVIDTTFDEEASVLEVEVSVGLGNNEILATASEPITTVGVVAPECSAFDDAEEEEEVDSGIQIQQVVELVNYSASSSDEDQPAFHSTSDAAINTASIASTETEPSASEEAVIVPDIPLNSFIMGENDAGGWTTVEVKAIKRLRNANHGNKTVPTSTKATTMATNGTPTPLKPRRNFRAERAYNAWVLNKVTKGVDADIVGAMLAAKASNPAVVVAAHNQTASTPPRSMVSWAKIASTTTPKKAPSTAATPIKARMVVLGSK